MEETLQFLVRHGYVVLFLFVLAEQIGPRSCSSATARGH